MPPTIHVTQYSTSALETNKTESRYYFIIPCKIIQGVRVLETLYFPENKNLGYRTTQSCAARRCPGQARCAPRGRTGRLRQKSNYEPFNRNYFNIRYWSWELPRLLAPNLPSNRFSQRDLNAAHSNYKTWVPCMLISRHYLRVMIG